MASVITAGTASNTALNLTGDTSGELQLKTNNGSTTAMTLTTGGNVGVGTTSPSTTLDVTHSNGGAVSVRGVSGDGARIRLYNNAAATNQFQVGQGFGTGSDNVGYVYNTANAALIFGTNNSERMRITASGDVTQATGSYFLGNGGGFGWGDLSTYVGGTSASDFINFITDSAERMRITSDGNLLVGTNLNIYPATNRTVINVNGTSEALIGMQTGGTARAYILHDGTNQYFWNQSNGFQAFASNNSERMRAFADGRIGIGTPTGTQDRVIQLTADPDSHSASVVPSSLRFGNTGNFEVRYVRNGANTLNNAFLRFSTHVGGVFAGIRMNLDIDGNLYPEGDNVQTCGKNGSRWSAIWAANGTIQTSDERQKTDIADSSLGLNFITALKPVSYKWKVGGNTVRTNFDSEIGEDGQHEQIVTPIAGKRTHYGLLAQQVKEVLGEQDFGGFIYDQDTDTYALRYDQFISPLIKAVQEQQAMIEELKAEVALLKSK